MDERHAPGVRLLTVHPDPARGSRPSTTELDVEPGTTVGELRPHLARLTGWAGWASTAVRTAVDDTPLDETHRAGHHPLVPGAVLRAGPGTPPPEHAAVGARWHVAVVAGPDSGALVAVPVAGVAHLVRADGDGTVDDPSAGPLVVRGRRGRVQVRAGTEGTLTRRRRARGRARPRRLRARRWTRWREGDVLRVGRSTFALRGRDPGGAGSDATRRRVERPGSDLPVTAWLAPLLGSVALAAVVRQPALLLLGVVTPLVAVAAQVLQRRRRARSVVPPDGGDDAPVPVRTPTDPADLVAATTRALHGAREPARGGAPWATDGTLAVVGAPDDADAVARGVVLGELGTHLHGALVLLTRRPASWSWAAAAEPGTALPGHADDDTVVVCDDLDAVGRLAPWRTGAPARHRLLLVVRRRADVPAWCRHVLEVGPDRVLSHQAGAPPAVVARQAVTPERARRQLVRARTVRDLTADGELAPALASSVALGDLPGVPEPCADALTTAWARPPDRLLVSLGRGAGRTPVAVDLVADGPHALVAGTTGAGKSELLSTLVLSLALTQPPDRLAVLLVDFKGGTGLGAVARLPHVVDHVTDLDATRTRRVLVGLRAEARRRERILAERDAHDLADLDPDDVATPPRLLVVVDELRALADDVPDAVPALARLAAQGRALGMHLVLATQRPAGVVTADLRANVDLRIALRVTDEADSRDVVDGPEAARLDPRAPGRAVLRRGSLPLETVQVARPRPGSATPPARLACAGVGARPDDPGRGWVPTPAAARETATPDGASVWVAAAQQAASGRLRPLPWLPALPDTVTTAEVPAGHGLAVALADLPDEQRRAGIRWDPRAGHLLVLGGPGSGRTTALTTVGLEALAAGHVVHAVGLPADAVERLRRGDVHGTLGTVTGTHEVRRLARLLELAAGSGTPAILLVDGLTGTLDALGSVARGAGADRLTACWRTRGDLAVAASADLTSAAVHHAPAFRDRLVLPVADGTLDALAGVPSAQSGPRRTPGRAVHLRDATAVLCQVAQVPSSILVAPSGAADPTVVRVAPLPSSVDLPTADPPTAPTPGARGSTAGAAATAVTATAATVAVGLGGDDAGEVAVDAGRPLLIAGPPGSGRSNAVAVVAAGLVARGRRVVRLVPPAGSTPTRPLPGVVDVTPDELPTSDVTVLVDDLDELERTSPATGDVVESLARGGRGPVVVAATTAGAAGAFRGPHAALLRHRQVLVLDAHEPAGAELVGPAAPWLVDPHERPQGRGVLVVGRRASPVQVYRWAGLPASEGRPAVAATTGGRSRSTPTATAPASTSTAHSVTS